MSLGDDLDDGLEYEVQESDSEAAVEVPGSPIESETVKRSRRSSETDDSNKSQSKRQKKLANSKLHQKKLEKMEHDAEQKKLLPRSSSERISEYLATLIREKNPDLSALELEEQYFKKTNFISTERYEKERNLDNLQDFVNTFSKSPRAVVLSASNIRVADVFRSLGGSQTAVKLFSKTKLKDDVARVDQLLKGSDSKDGKTGKSKAKDKKKEKEVKYYISTPARMAKITEATDSFFEGKEKLDIFLDASYLDPKTNTLFTSEDCAALFKVLRDFLNKKSSVKILLF
ncbi:LANO_0E14950g1_1 [Lachancea nothofagi CBS 11611]|uniref:LANO_0E14950g1_1 n=1 Tax=Lachancea nothofagi CBS 11611 TaxID=1266666 RepID=A0A1G4K0I4_9SACH|nr:LANO_0E14950g1_1 [Lachancea nothofagi CBS 11611]